MGVYLLHRHAENLQQSLLEFKANYKLPKVQDKPNPVCMVAKQAVMNHIPTHHVLQADHLPPMFFGRTEHITARCHVCLCQNLQNTHNTVHK